MPRPCLILDCDPGHDDAIAMIAAARHAQLLGITTVSGNVGLELTTRNALVTTQIAGIDAPVFAGANRPLVAEPRHAEFIHGKSGLDGPELPPLKREAAGRDAVRFIVDTVRSREDVWLVAIGPLTNVALALRSAPDIGPRLAGIAIMGGGISFGNVTAAAEFNILADPEAAAIVFEAPVRRVLAPLDLTHQLLMGEEESAAFRATGTDSGRFVADLLDFYRRAYERRFSRKLPGPLHDPCAVLAVTHPEIFDRVDMHVVVELGGHHTRGMTLADRRGVYGASPANTQVLTTIDVPRARSLLLEAVVDR